MYDTHRLGAGRETAPAAGHHTGEAGVRITSRLRNAVWRLANAAVRHGDRQHEDQRPADSAHAEITGAVATSEGT